MMLESIHLSLWLDYYSPLSRALLLIHFGLFLLWQPIWKNDETFSYTNGFLFIVLTLLFVYWINLTMLTAWLILLIGFLGGIIKQKREESLTFLTALACLIMECLFRSAPELFSIQLPKPTEIIFRNVLFLLPLLILFYHPYEQRKFHVDLLRAITSSLLISLLMFGSLLNTLLSDTSYQDALVQSIMILALGLISISWLLSPKFGFSGLSQLWSQSLLNIGTPFERWMTTLSHLQQRTHDPGEFLNVSMKELIQLEWITGVEWHYQDNTYLEGEKSSHQLAIKLTCLDTTLYTAQLSGTALQIHCNMLIKLIETMYVAKVNERHIADQTYLLSVYETGARITHDIKNLLQSLKLLTGVIERNNNEDKENQSIQLIKQQLPGISNRLEMALEKLQKPSSLVSEKKQISKWISETQQRMNYEIRVDTPLHDTEIPAELFDSVLDNLIDNFERKKKEELTISFSIKLISNKEKVSLILSDTGSAIPNEIISKLFTTVIESESGLGIGLFQLANMAEINGYELGLLTNQEGNVAFELKQEIQRNG